MYMETDADGSIYPISTQASIPSPRNHLCRDPLCFHACLYVCVYVCPKRQRCRQGGSGRVGEESVDCIGWDETLSRESLDCIISSLETVDIVPTTSVHVSYSPLTPLLLCYAPRLAQAERQKGSYVGGSGAASPALLFLCAMRSKGCLAESVASFEGPPKNREIALWPNMRVVKCKYHVSQK